VSCSSTGTKVQTFLVMAPEQTAIKDQMKRTLTKAVGILKVSHTLYISIIYLDNLLQIKSSLPLKWQTFSPIILLNIIKPIKKAFFLRLIRKIEIYGTTFSMGANRIFLDLPLHLCTCSIPFISLVFLDLYQSKFDRKRNGYFLT